MFYAQVVALLLALWVSSAWAASSSPISLSPPDKTTLQEELDEIKNSGLALEQQEILRNILAQSLENLKQQENFKNKTTEFLNQQSSGSKQLDELQNAIKKISASKQSFIEQYQQLSIDDAQLELGKQESLLTSVNQQIQSLENEVNERSNRLTAVRSRSTAIRTQQTQNVTELERLKQDSTTQFQQAKLWRLQTQQARLQAEINALEAETDSAPIRGQLNEAALELARQQQNQLKLKIDALQNTLLSKRNSQAQATLNKAEIARSQMANLNPAMSAFANQSEYLSRELTRMTEKISSYYLRRDEVKNQTNLLQREFNSTQMKIELAGLSEQLGELLINQRNLLPSVSSYRKERQAVYVELSSVTLQRLERQSNLGWRFNTEEYVNELLSGLDHEPTRQERDSALSLIQQRLDILKKLDETSDTYLHLLTELDQELSVLVQVVEAYSAFLAQHLMWVRSPLPVSQFSASALLQEWQSMVQFLRQPVDLSFGESLSHTHLIAESILLLLTIIFMVSSRRLRSHPGFVIDHHRVPPLNVIRYLLLALSKILPYSIAVHLFTTVVQKIYFPDHAEMLLGDLWLYVLLTGLWYQLAKTNGLLLSYLLWPQEIVTQSRKTVRWLYWIASPILLAALIPINILQKQGGGLTGSMLLLAAMVIFNYSVFRFLNQPFNILTGIKHHQLQHGRNRVQNLFCYGVCLVILFWIICFAFGYHYASQKVCAAIFETLFLFGFTLMLQQIATIWLQQLQLKETLILRREQTELLRLQNPDTSERELEISLEQVNEQSKNVKELGEENRKLIQLSGWLVTLSFCYVIWSPLLPAAEILEGVVLWSFERQQQGATVYQTVTLKALIWVIIGIVGLITAARRLPPFVEMILLNRLALDSGMKYTIKTLMSYVFFGSAIIFTTSSLGFSWDKIQWAVAALSVGIGFGLQEIVANFISGLIILFERPIRVGDLVTIGGQTGTVRRIQIRATTIVDFDNKELLVPNKDFITNPLLNWTLSDREVRVLISVGISYSSDFEQALKLLDEIAKGHPKVLAEPAPVVTFESFGDNTLNLCLRCRIGSIDDRLQVVTELHKDIMRSYREHGIEIAFPQRDLHIDSKTPLEIVLKRASPTPAAPIQEHMKVTDPR